MIRTLNVRARIEYAALAVVLSVGLISIGASFGRIVVLAWIYSGSLSHIQGKYFALCLIFTRLEVLLGTIAYTLASCRALLRSITAKVQTLAPHQQSLHYFSINRRRHVRKQNGTESQSVDSERALENAEEGASGAR